MSEGLHLDLNEQESIFILKFVKESVERVLDEDTEVATKREIQNAFYASIAISYSRLKELKGLKSLEGELESN